MPLLRVISKEKKFRIGKRLGAGQLYSKVASACLFWQFPVHHPHHTILSSSVHTSTSRVSTFILAAISLHW